MSYSGWTWWGLCAWVGVAYWRGSWRWLAVGVPALVVQCLWLPTLSTRVWERWETYRLALRISLEHPLVGVGEGPLALPTLCRVAGMPLPGPHSDWVTMALLHGWPATLLTLGLMARLLWPRRSGHGLVVQALLLTLVLISAGRSAVVHPGYVLSVVVCSGYLLLTKEHA